MKVLFHIPFQVLQRADGGKTVFFKTREYLERAGVQVDLFDPWRSDFKQYDLIHCFTMESVDMWSFVRADGMKLAVTPISWFAVYATHRSRMWRWLKRRVRSRLQCPLHPYWWEDCFGYPDLFFAHAHEQARQLRIAFGVPAERIHVVHHGVDPRFMDADMTAFERRYNTRDFVLCVGRFEVRKNQLSLIRAFRDTGVPLVFIGRADTVASSWYYEQCRSEAKPSTLFITDIDHDSPMLASAYAAARVLVLPSFLEAPGLAALEAGLAGCNVAVTEVGGTHEYFGPHATYLDPRSLDSIRASVLECYRNGPRPNRRLQEHIKTNFLWEHVVRANVEGYRRILGSSHPLDAGA